MGIYERIVKEDPALAAALLRDIVAATANPKQNKDTSRRIEGVQRGPQLVPPDNIGVAPTGPSTAAGTIKTKRASARHPKVGRKLSPERMLVVVAALREYPILARAAAKAGIHHKTLAYWLKCSAAGHDGYDIEWQGETWRFHELCESAISEAHDTVHFLMWQMAMGIKFKVDPSLVKLGYKGADAYATDENGDYIEEGVRQPNPKMMEIYLAWMRPERWGKPPKRDISRTGGVLVVGERSARPKTVTPEASRPDSGSRFRELPSDQLLSYFGNRGPDLSDDDR
jgi:hypothetical protein